MPETHSSPTSGRGLSFSPGQAKLLLISLAVLGVGVLAWIKTCRFSGSEPAAEKPALAMPEEIFEPYKRLLAPPPSAPASTSVPSRTPTAEQRKPKDEKVFEINLD